MVRISEEDFENIVRLTPLVSIDLVLRDPDDFVWLGRRNNEPAKGTFFVPGGIIRKDETIASAFQRILAVETGLSLPHARARLLGAYDHIYPNNRFGNAPFGTHYVVLGHELRLTQRPKIVMDSQHNDFRWMTVPELLASDEVHVNTKRYFQDVDSQAPGRPTLT